MAGKPGSPPDDLTIEEALAADPFAFGFFQALRRFDCAHPDKPRLGEGSVVADEYVRLGQDPSLAFAASTLSSFTKDGPGHRPRLGVNFFGLFGPNGPLPLHLTEYAHQRITNSGDRTFAAFADIFHHRLLELFHRAWAQAQPTVSYDRPEADRFGEYVASLAGHGMPAFKQRSAAPDLALLSYCGHYGRQTKNADGLCDLLADYFEMPITIEEFQGTWLEIADSEKLRLGSSEEGCCLGVSTVVGSRVFDRQLKFRIVAGPLPIQDFERLLPDQESFERMKALVRAYVGDELDWELQLVLGRDEVPALTLGSFGRLGWTTYMLNDAPEHDPGDLVIHPATVGGRVQHQPAEAM